MNALAPACLFFLLPFILKPRLFVVGLLILGMFWKDAVTIKFPEWEKLKTVLQNQLPDYEFMLSEKEFNGKWERTPYVWKEFRIYARRINQSS